FTQEDTYRGDGLNLYAYCANNPVSYVDPSGNQCQAAKDRLAASTSKGKNETKTSTKLAAHQDSSSKGAGGSEIKGGKNPNGYKAGDIDEHGFLSPGKNRADGNHNVANEGRYNHIILFRINGHKQIFLDIKEIVLQQYY
ncbi:RHS repeat-associated protein, partial [Lachnotalea glycerini]